MAPWWNHAATCSWKGDEVNLHYCWTTSVLCCITRVRNIQQQICVSCLPWLSDQVLRYDDVICHLSITLTQLNYITWYIYSWGVVHITNHQVILLPITNHQVFNETPITNMKQQITNGQTLIDTDNEERSFYHLNHVSPCFARTITLHTHLSNHVAHSFIQVNHASPAYFSGNNLAQKKYVLALIYTPILKSNNMI